MVSTLLDYYFKLPKLSQEIIAYLCTILYLIFLILAFMFLWNATLPILFKVHSINFNQSFCLLLLFQVLNWANELTNNHLRK